MTNATFENNHLASFIGCGRFNIFREVGGVIHIFRDVEVVSAVGTSAVLNVPDEQGRGRYNTGFCSATVTSVEPA
jgi:hypothetical protein